MLAVSAVFRTLNTEGERYTTIAIRLRVVGVVATDVVGSKIPRLPLCCEMVVLPGLVFGSVPGNIAAC